MDYITYVVKKNETLEPIATRFGCTVQDIMDANPDTIKHRDDIKAGQIIRIPVKEMISDGPQKIDVHYDLEGKQNVQFPTQNVHFPLQDTQNDKKVTDNCQECENTSQEPPKRKTGKFRISMFFDGTGNNRDNTEFGKSKDGKNLEVLKKLIHPVGVGVFFDELASFSNDYTNIYRLEEKVSTDQDGYDFSASIYIEGIGTKDNSYGMHINDEDQLIYVKSGENKKLKKKSLLEIIMDPDSSALTERNTKVADIKDDFKGMSAGEGSTGIKEKSKKGVSEIIEKITGNIGSFDSIDLDIDAFGFSRGAAAARNFIHLIKGDSNKTLIDMMLSEGVTVDRVDIKFIGLFDTVSALGSVKKDTESYKKEGKIDDVDELNLDVFKTVDAENVVHLCAAEEYRNAFKLVNIKSALDKGNGIEIFLPGAHSDVGGSYNNDSSEGYKNDKDGEKDAIKSKYQVLDLDEELEEKLAKKRNGRLTAKEIVEADKKWLKNLGWYKETDDENNEFVGTGISDWRLQINVRRKNIKNTYSYIPLQIMHDFALHKGSLKFGKTFYAKDGNTLQELQTILDQDIVLKKVNTVIGNYVDTYSTRTDSECMHWEVVNSTNEEIWNQFRHDYLHFSSYFYTTLWDKDFGYLKPAFREDLGTISKEEIINKGMRERHNVDG